MTGDASALAASDRELLNLVQQGMPLERRPFHAVGRALGLTEAEVLGRLVEFSRAGLVRHIGGVFEPSLLGYRSTLAALAVEATRLERAAAQVNAHPGVSHNYSRNHRFNLWFTLSLPQEQDLDSAVESLAGRAGATAWLNLPALRVFKLRVFFDMGGDGGGAMAFDPDGTSRRGPGSMPLSLEDRRVVRELCRDLPLVERPFDLLARDAGMATGDFIERALRLRAAGVMRRFGAALRHRQAGFVANAMSCWSVPPERVEAVAAAACKHGQVSHCYERRTTPGWPFNLFAMIHGRSRDACEEVAAAITRDTGAEDRVMLYSDREYKKEKVRYFGEVE